MLAAACAAAAPALAHDGFGDSRSVGSGALHLLTSPLSIAGLVGLAAALFRVEKPWPACAVFAAALAIGATFHAGLPSYAAPALVALAGLVAAAGVRPGPPVAVLLALCAGLGAGIATDLDQVTVGAVLGACATAAFAIVGLVAGLADLAGVARLQAVLPIAVRIAGSWVAALSLLLGALAAFTARS